MKIKAFDVAIKPIHSRGNFHENLLFFSGAKKIIGSAVDQRSRFRDDDYDILLPIFDHTHFEFYRNESFILGLTGEDAQTKFALPFNKNSTQNNVVIFPGAGNPLRRWSKASFAELINRIEKEYPSRFNFIVAGGKNDAIANSNVKDLTGKTSLLELIDLIGSCDLLISNETSAVHIAAATGARAICISNGNHFGRFNPYPKELTDKIVYVYPSDKYYSKERTIISELVAANRVASNTDINVITVDTAFEAFRKLYVNSVP